MTFGNVLDLLYHHGSFKDFLHWCRIEESAANGKVMQAIPYVMRQLSSHDTFSLSAVERYSIIFIFSLQPEVTLGRTTPGID